MLLVPRQVRGNVRRLPGPAARRDLPMIHVLAIITAKPGMRDRILAAYRANVDAVRAEVGCIAYEAVVDARDTAAGLSSKMDSSNQSLILKLSLVIRQKMVLKIVFNPISRIKLN